MESNRHDLRCVEVPLSDLVTEAEAKGDEVPESVKRIADEGFGFMHCHDECPVKQRAVARGIELAERFGW